MNRELCDGKELTAADAADGLDAIIVAARMILGQKELQIGDQLCIIRL